MTHPEAQRIADEGTQRSARHRVGPVDLPKPDQHADGEQQRQRGHDGAQHNHRITERDGNDHHASQDGVVFDPLQRGVDPCVHP